MCNWIDTDVAKPGHGQQVLLWAPETEEFALAEYNALSNRWIFNDGPSENANLGLFRNWTFLSPPTQDIEINVQAPALTEVQKRETEKMLTRLLIDAIRGA